jgi:hypothetical protein
MLSLSQKRNKTKVTFFCAWSGRKVKEEKKQSLGGAH